MNEDIWDYVRGLFAVILAILGFRLIGIGMGWPAKTCISAERAPGDASGMSSPECTSASLQDHAAAVVLIVVDVAIVLWAVYYLFFEEIERIVASFRTRVPW